MHPTYMSVFALFSMVSAFMLRKENSISSFVFGTLVSILLVYTFLLMSLAGLLSVMFLGAIIVLIYLKNRFSIKTMLLIALIGAVAFSSFILTTPFMQDDIKEAIKTTNRYSKSPKDFIQNLSESPSSSETRLVMWSISLEEIKKHPFGVGTGNVDIYLGKNITAKGNPSLAEKQYNPHNQFLQTQLEIGIVGLLILLFITVGGIIYSIRKRNILLIILFSSLLLNSLFESMLQLQAGIIFYLYFFMLIIIADQSNPKKSLS